MSIIETIRPTSTGIAGSTTLTGAASRHAALSDDSDSSYVVMDANPVQSMWLNNDTGHTITPPYARHRFRLRTRLSNGDCDPPCKVGWIAKSSSTPYGQGYTPTASEFAATTYAQAWKKNEVAFPELTSLDPSQAMKIDWILNTLKSSNPVQIKEVYLDFDTRHSPTFDPGVEDGAGNPVADLGTITDTNAPVATLTSLDTDGLPVAFWTLTLVGVANPTPLIYSGTGPPPSQLQLFGLPNDDWTMQWVVTSYLGNDTEFPSDTWDDAYGEWHFEIDFTAPFAPDLTAVLSPEEPGVDLTVVPGGVADGWDTNQAVIEIRRTDCAGTQIIYVEYLPLGGTIEFTDRTMSLSRNGGEFCGDEDHVCQVCYEARQTGYIDLGLVQSEWSEPECLTVENPEPGSDWLRGPVEGDLAFCPARTYTRSRPFGAFQRIEGGIPVVVTGTPGGRDYTLSFTVPDETTLDLVEAILDAPLHFYQPEGSRDLWQAPNPQSVEFTTVNGRRRVTFSAVEVEPQPWPDPFDIIGGPFAPAEV